MPGFMDDSGIKWDDMIWADEGGVALFIRRLDTGGVQLRISERGEVATATIAQFRLSRIAEAIQPGIDAEQRLYEKPAQ